MPLLQEQPVRMLEEKRQIDQLAAENSWFIPGKWLTAGDDGLLLEFTIVLASVNFDGVLAFPLLFPETPAFIYPQKSGEHWSEHQYRGTGVLCLEYGPDNWHANVTGSDLICSAFKLLAHEAIATILEEAPTTPSRHQETLGQRLRFKKNRLVATPQLLERLKALPDRSRERIQSRVTILSDVNRTIITGFGSDSPERIVDVPKGLDEEGYVRPGWAICDLRLSGIPTFSTAAELRTYLEGIDCWPWEGGASDTSQMLLLCTPTGEFKVFTVFGSTPPIHWECEIVRFDNEDYQRLPLRLGEGTKDPVAIVGLGSVGSKIAVSLARSGVRNFILVDDDILVPQNLVRHQLTWRDVGFHKTDSMAQELKLIAPDIDVLPVSSRFAGQESAKHAQYLAAALSLCKVVVDATADPGVFVSLAALCKRAKISLVWGELFAGGGGAFMARSRAGIDADALTIRNHINGCLEELPPAPDKKATSYDVIDGEKPLVATDAEVSALAASMAQFTLDTLSQPRGESEFPHSAYLMGYKKYWVFAQPFATIPIDCPSAPQEELSAPSVPAELQDALDAFAAQIQGSPIDENNRPS